MLHQRIRPAVYHRSHDWKIYHRRKSNRCDLWVLKLIFIKQHYSYTFNAQESTSFRKEQVCCFSSTVSIAILDSSPIRWSTIPNDSCRIRAPGDLLSVTFRSAQVLAIASVMQESDHQWKSLRTFTLSASGFKFAQTEVKVTAATLLRRFKFAVSRSCKKPIPSWQLVLKPLRGIELIICPR